VAALVAIVGLLIARGVFNTYVLIPKSSDRLVNSSTVWYALVSALVALLATLLSVSRAAASTAYPPGFRTA
jgi:hypothetical protein